MYSFNEKDKLVRVSFQYPIYWIQIQSKWFHHYVVHFFQSEAQRTVLIPLFKLELEGESESMVAHERESEARVKPYSLEETVFIKSCKVEKTYGMKMREEGVEKYMY